MQKKSQILLSLITILLISTLVACQKKQLDLAEAKPDSDAPAYTVEANVNVPGGIEKPAEDAK